MIYLQMFLAPPLFFILITFLVLHRIVKQEEDRKMITGLIALETAADHHPDMVSNRNAVILALCYVIVFSGRGLYIA